jgi:hypothetical protein
VENGSECLVDYFLTPLTFNLCSAFFYVRLENVIYVKRYKKKKNHAYPHLL